MANDCLGIKPLLISVLKAILLLLVPYMGQSQPARGQEQPLFEIRNFTRADYRSENQNWALAIDNMGFVYGANNVGLIEFDGVDWSYHPSPNGTVIRSVATDENNRIYTSGYREIGYWERNRYGELEYTSLNNLAESLFTQNEEFWNTVIIGNRVFFHSFSSVFIYENDSFTVVRADDLIHSISKVGENLVMHIHGKGLYLLKDTTPEHFLSDQALRVDIVHFCFELEDHGIVVGTASSGMFLYRDGKLQPYLEQWGPYFSENKINRGMLMNNGRVVIGTLLDGVLVFDLEGQLLHHIHSGNGLQNNTVLGMCGDTQNNLWMALDQGVDFISFQMDPSFSYIECEGVGAVYDAVLFNGELYLCTNQGVFYRRSRAEEEAFEMIPGTQGQAWSAEVFDQELIVSHNNGTFRIENHRAVPISPVAGGFSLIRNPMDANGLVQSTYSNIVFFGKESGHWQYAFQIPGFNDLIRFIQMDHLNNLWASHMHRAVYRLRLDDRQRNLERLDYYGQETFSRDFDIHVFKVENRIVFTTGERIYTFDDIRDSIVPYEAFNNSLGIHARAHRIVTGPDHHYWFIGRERIGLIHFSEGESEVLKEFPTGLFRNHLISGYENIFPLDKVTGLLCLDNGLAELKADAPDLSRQIESKSPMLKGISVGGRTGSEIRMPLGTKNFSVPFNRNSVTLEFAFPLYSTEPVLFQYFVEGLDQTWSEPHERPVFQFTRIPAGQYVIRVRAFDSWNRLSQVEEVSLLVRRPWYISTVSLIFYGFLLLWLLLAGRALLLRRIRLREASIKESKERELIRLRNEKLHAELSHKSQELANSTMAIIKKNEFLMDLKEALKMQKEELGSRYPDKYHHRLVKKIDQNISSMDDWKVFEFHFEKAHEKFLQKLRAKYPQLSHSDLRLCAYLRMNLSSKEIAPLLRISYRGVENHRYRLRKKLHLKKEVDLTDFMLSV